MSVKRTVRRRLQGPALRALGVVSRLTEDEGRRRVRAWHEVDGDRTLRLDYDLGADDVVLDVGGYEGQWASDIFGRYVSTIHVFEPVPSYAERIAARFERNERVHVHPIALGAEEGEVSISVAGDRSSLHRGDGSVRVRVARAADYLEDLGIEDVGLAKLNIEGAEYDLLEHLLDTGWLRRIRHVQVQFHDFFPDAGARMAQIQQGLTDTHDLTWQHPWVWESWHRRQPR